jgi:hypothetical protein
VRLDSMTGAQCAVSIATAPAEDASNSSPFTPAEAASIKGVVSGAGSLIPQRTHLRRSLAKLGGASTSPCVANVFGHSIVDGGYANDDVKSIDLAVETIFEVSGFVGVLRRLFANRFGTVCGDAYMPAGSQNNRLAKAGGTTNTPGSSQGFGGSYTTIPANATPSTNTLTFAVNGTVCRVRGMIAASGGQINYTVDGGATTAAAPASTVQTPRVNGFYWLEVDLPLGADGAHTVVIQAHATASTIIFDVRGVSDITKGVLVGRYGFSGKCLPDMFAHALDATDVAGPASWLSSIAATGYFDQQLQSVIGRSNLPTYSKGAATMTIASPAVVSFVGHKLNANDPVQFTTTGALPTGVTASVNYYAMSSGLTADAFQISATPGGAAIVTTGAQSGVHTLIRVCKGFSTDLAIIMCDVNDSSAGVAYGYSLADVQRHAQNVANKIVALGCDVLFVTGPRRQTWPASWTQDQNTAAYKAVADATDHVGHLDLTPLWADWADANAAGLMVDYTHLSSRGHAWDANAIYNALIAAM